MIIMNDYYLINKINDTNDYSKLSDEDIKRIKLLKIPPNWVSVKISKDHSTKVQVTGEDSKGRTQYIYHPVWTLFSRDTKYSKVNSINFTKFNSVINNYSRDSIDKKCTFSKTFIIANMFILMRDLNIRVGNEKYLEENDSVGLCTLQKSHYKKVKDENKDENKNKNKDEIIHKLIFKGKRGVIQEKILTNYHINFIENIMKIPGKSLFKYSIKNDEYKKVNADDLNLFLKEHIDTNMTCKDIRTYCANKIFKKEYSRLLNSGIQQKKAIIEATKVTARELGNTPKVCKDSYIDPTLYID